MSAPTDAEFVARLLLAAGCGLLIGIERQYRSRTAGLRTNALVAAGAAAFVLFGEQTATPAASLQITAYVVSGVGFLGGGVILRQGFNVQGLNTAATLWCSAAIGAQAAAGHVVPALATTGVVIGIHLLLRPLGRLVDRVPAAKDEAIAAYLVLVRVQRKQEAQLRAQLLQMMAGSEFMVRGLTTEASPGSDDPADLLELQVDVLIEGNAPPLLDSIVTRLSLQTGVQGISWQAEDSDVRSDDDRDEVHPTIANRLTWLRHRDPPEA